MISSATKQFLTTHDDDDDDTVSCTVLKPEMVEMPILCRGLVSLFLDDSFIVGF